jgi:hypothetical protein
LLPSYFRPSAQPVLPLSNLAPAIEVLLATLEITHRHRNYGKEYAKAHRALFSFFILEY